MTTPLTKQQAETLLYILTRTAKHRSIKPFTGEFISHVTSNETFGTKYWFLNEDYHQFELTGGNETPFKLTALSEDVKVLALAQRVNDDIAFIFYGQKEVV
jgi:hypothetical protein